jgi:hypothetical protein
MMKDRFPPNDRLPLFLSDPAGESEQSGIRKAVSSDIFRKVVFVFAAIAVVFAAVTATKLILFASVTASEVNTPATQDGSDHPMPAIQSTASADALPRTAPGDELLAAFKSALEIKTEVDQPRTEALLDGFQAWAAEEDAQARARPPPPVQGDQAQSAQRARALPLPKPRPIEAARRAQYLSPQNTHWPVRSFSWHN